MIRKDGVRVQAEVPTYGGGDVRVTSSTPEEILQGSWHQLPQIEHDLVVAGSVAPSDYASSIEANAAADVIISIAPSAPIPTYGDSNYSSPSPTSGTPTVVMTPEEYHAPTEKVVAPSVSKTFLTGSEHGMEWGWEQIRDYVVAGIEQQTGSFPRNPLTEAGIFKGFKARWGELAGPIAIYAIDVAEAWWQNAPISVNRFCKGSDPYFADPISKRVESALALTG